VDPTSAEPGAYSVITFRVPSESATATTTSVEVQLPTDTPLSSVRYVPVAGWTTVLTTTTLPEPVLVGENTITEAVTSVTWTAEPGSEIGEGALQLFPLSVGPIPDTGSLVLPAIQTYSDGSVVEWTETADDAEHPAPVLFINDTPVSHHDDDGDGDDEVTVDGSDRADAATPASSTSDDILARILGIGGLVVGAVGIVLAVARRRPAGE
jgi:uncharacterized protein YcnI